jgi:hypothetical protein
MTRSMTSTQVFPPLFLLAVRAGSIASLLLLYCMVWVVANANNCTQKVSRNR